MARPRSNTATLIKEGHSLSLKVLRLSKPSLAQQNPLPHGTISGNLREASLAFPSRSIDQDFILTPNFVLPPAFGSAYVGETFACALCANNELSVDGINLKAVSGVRLTAEMQTPTQTLPLTLHPAPDSPDEATQLESSSSVQKIVSFDLKEEGSHTLSVGVSYSETSQGDGAAATSGRARTFRKMYQFIAQPCLSVRTKATELTPIDVPDKALGPYGRSHLVRYVLEAQVENVSDGKIVLQNARVQSRPPFKSTPLNGGLGGIEAEAASENYISPRDVLQIAFLVEQESGVTAGLEEMKANLKHDGRTVVGQIALEWQSQMGERGSLSTGNLFTRRR